MATRTRTPVAVATPRATAANGGETAARNRRGRVKSLPDPVTSQREYSQQELIVLRAAEQYRQERHKPFLNTSDYLDLFRSKGWLNESAITL